MGPTSGAKDAARADLLAARGRRSDAELAAVGQALAAHLAGDAALHGARRIAAYLSMRGEPRTDELIADRLTVGAEVIVPLTRPEGTLDWALHDPSAATTRSALGVLEPAGPTPGRSLHATDLVLVPALAVDHHGRRLGRGAGYYDRALSALMGLERRPTICAVVFAEELLPEIPVEPHDVPVDLVLTEAGVFRPMP